MSKIDNGGPAFPSEGEGHGNPKYHSPGMSLRDWFAGTYTVPDGQFATNSWAAAVMGEQPPQWGVGNDLDCVRWWFRVEAKLRLEYADAMLAERAKAEGQS